jgi:hypothetical protein
MADCDIQTIADSFVFAFASAWPLGVVITNSMEFRAVNAID